MNVTLVKSGEGRVVPLGSIHMIVQEDGTNTRGTMGIAEFIIPAHATAPITPPPHIHHAHEEGFYILEGDLEFLAGTQTVQASTGALVMVPIGTVHTFSNPFDRPARFLNTFTPPRYIQYFEELSGLFQRDGVPDHQQLTELMARYQTEVVA
jgi:mannose-6-phosphate isomerase-like protein (cupin superfamily)